MNRTVRLAKETVFWPNITQDIINFIKQCKICMKFKSSLPKEPLRCYDIPNLPWERLSCDLFELYGKTYLIVVDSFSKYPEVEEMNAGTSSDTVIKKLKSIFSRHGIPKQFVSDNGPQFSSAAFRDFSREYNFQHIRTSPMYSQSNGFAERTVQTIKNMYKKALEDNKDFYLMLLNYRNTPLSNTLESPAKLLMSRTLRGILPQKEAVLKPFAISLEKTKRELRKGQELQKFYYNKGSRQQPALNVGQKVYLQQKKTWEEGTIVKKNRERSYTVKTNKIFYKEIGDTWQLFPLIVIVMS